LSSKKRKRTKRRPGERSEAKKSYDQQKKPGQKARKRLKGAQPQDMLAPAILKNMEDVPALQADFDVANLAHATTGYIGAPMPNKPVRHHPKVEELLRRKYRYKEWDGK
jgi:hypothetical protein